MISVAIDGPAGAGKSTIARAVAQKLGYLYVDTGALYRAIGLYARRQGADPAQGEQVCPLLPQIQLSLRYVDGVQHVTLNGEDVSEDIRLPEMSSAASQVSAIPQVRDFLFDLQQNLAQEHNVVMDGRDIGTVVLPQAQVKIYLTATPQERARRRHLELLGKGIDQSYDQVLQDVLQRDYNDSHRAVAPLKQAQDAVCIDTTGLDFEQSLQTVYQHILSRQAQV